MQDRAFIRPAENALHIFSVLQRLQITLRLITESLSHWLVFPFSMFVRHDSPPLPSPTRWPSPSEKQSFGKQDIFHAERMQSRRQEWCIFLPVVDGSSIPGPIYSFYSYNIASHIFNLLHNFMLPTLNSLWPLAFQKYSELSWTLLWTVHHLDLSF